MGVDGVYQGVDGRLGHHRQDALADKLERLGPDDVYAQDLAVRFVGYYLDETSVLPENAGLAVGGERELADLHAAAFGAGLSLGQPDAADAGLGVGATGNPGLVDRDGGLAGHVRDGDHPLGGCHVRQLRRPGHDVADGVDARLTGALVFVDFDEAAVKLDAGALQPNVLGNGFAADGDEQRLGFHRFLLAVRERHREADAAVGLLHVFRARAGFDANAGLLEVVLEFFGAAFQTC